MTQEERRMSRRSLLRVGALAGTGLAAALIVGCGDDGDDAGNGGSGSTTAPAATTNPTDAAKEFALVSGWYRDRAVKYYDFGMNSPASGNTIATAPIWVLITGMEADGTPRFVDGQHNIIDARPGDSGYSDLWQVHMVTVPDGYVADTLKSAEDVTNSGYEVTPVELLVNCPVVPDGSTLEGGEALVQGWYRGEEVFYPDFGGNPAVALPIWAFITGMDPSGNPQFVEGQNNVIDSVPGDDGYSAFWRVNLVTVPDGYEPNSVRSAAAAADAGYEMTQTDLVVNCPVTVF